MQRISADIRLYTKFISVFEHKNPMTYFTVYLGNQNCRAEVKLYILQTSLNLSRRIEWYKDVSWTRCGLFPISQFPFKQSVNSITQTNLLYFLESYKRILIIINILCQSILRTTNWHLLIFFQNLFSSTCIHFYTSSSYSWCSFFVHTEHMT